MKRNKISFLSAIFLFLATCAICLAFSACKKTAVYSVYYKSSAGGYIEGETFQKVADGEECASVTAVAAQGYRFVSWDDGVTDASRSDKEITEDKVFTAQFEEINFVTLKYRAQTGGYIVGEEIQRIEVGKSGNKVTAVAAPGYRFAGWDDGSYNAERIDENITVPVTLTAKFERIYGVYFISYNDKVGSVSGEVVQELALGETSSVVRAEPALGYTFIRWSNGFTQPEIEFTLEEEREEILIAYFEIEELSLPVMSIFTENFKAIDSKDDYVQCTVSLQNTDYKYEFISETGKIKGRGNTTWTLSKKPYKLKFDSKVDLFGNGKAKTWTLIANYTDLSMIRNYLAFYMGREQGMLDNIMYTTTAEFIELYVNYEYLGVYLVCEQNETGSTRVDIDEDLQDDEGNIKVNTGYLLERDAYALDEGLLDRDYFEIYGNPYAIKTPDTEDEYYLEHYEEFVAFIKGKTQAAIDALRAEKTLENYELVKTLVNINSFVDGFILDELTNTADGEYSSFYLYYDPTDGKFYRCAVWDYDASMGNAAYQPSFISPESMRVKDLDNDEQSITWYRYLIQFDAFKEAVEERLSQLSANGFMDKVKNEISEIIEMQDSFERNFEKWNVFENYDEMLTHWNPENIREIKSWIGQVEFVRDWLEKAFEYLVDYDFYTLS